MGSACHLKPPVTAGTRLSVTKAGLKSPITIPSRYFFFFFCGMWRSNRDAEAAGVGFVGKVCGAAEPHPVPSPIFRRRCLKLLDLGDFL